MAIPDLNSPLAPSFSVTIDGTALPFEAEAHVVDVSVDDAVELPSMFTLAMVGSADQKNNDSWVDDEKLFAAGKVVEIKMGYGDDVESLIIGEITGLEPEFIFNRRPSLIVRGYDRRHRLQRGRQTRTFIQQKDSDIAAKIAREAGLTPQATDSAVVHDYVIQANQTDLDFLQERARRIQFEVMVEDKKLFFRPVSNDQSEVLTLTMDDHLLEFYPQLTSIQQVSSVSVRGWSPKEKKELVGKAQAGDEVSTMGGKQSGPKMSQSAFGASVGMLTQPIMTQAEADQIAKARFNELALMLVNGEGICLGRTDMRAGKVIKIDGVGKRFSGQYYITAANHRYDPQNGYRTHFTVRRNAS
ncbi:MAG: contractile injection system protein, VgrG/Pvc8 family [Pyrinomonadaceae bacterium]